jgi:hypothetical protein
MRLCSALVLSLHSQTVLAQAPQDFPAPAPPPALAPYPLAPVVPVDILSANKLELKFRVSDEDNRPIAECPRNCQVLVSPGRYRLFVYETKDTVAGTRVVDIRGPTRLRVNPDTPTQRWTGLTMGIAGAILTVVGAGLFLSSSPDVGSEPREDRTQAQKDRGAIGGIMLLSGAVLTPIGWVMFGSSFKPDVEVERDSSDAWR